MLILKFRAIGYWTDFVVPQADHPLLVWLLLLLKFEHQSFVLNRTNTDEHYGSYKLLQNTDLNGNLQEKCWLSYLSRARKYAKFGVFYAKIVQMTPPRLRRESLWLQKFSVTNREPLRLQKFSVTNTVLSLPFSQQIQFTLIVNVVNLN